MAFSGILCCHFNETMKLIQAWRMFTYLSKQDNLIGILSIRRPLHKGQGQGGPAVVKELKVVLNGW